LVLYSATMACPANVTQCWLELVILRTSLRVAALSMRPRFLFCCSRDGFGFVGVECTVSNATLRALDLSLFAISVRSSSAKLMYCLMIASSVSVASFSFFLILRWIRLCRHFVDFSLNRLAALVGLSSGLGSAEKSAKLEYALLISI
jgi:hypothetical protein